ncbi:retrovirus-related pol polyprotein from transposon TNT 1-94 [Tanacetum coccineum]
MATVSNVPQLVNKKGGSYAAIAPKLELRKFNKWKKRMLCYLAGMEPYYIQCIKDGPFKPKTIEDDIMGSVISYETTKDTWTDLVYSFEGPSDTKENMIMNLKLEYQTFRAKPSESLSQTYTHYKTSLNELSNDGVNLSKHEINTLNLADIYGRFVYEDNLIQRRYSDTKKALITTPSNTAISTAFFSNNVVQDFQENSDDETPKAFQPKNKGLVAETFDWDEEEVSDDEEVTQVKVLMALADDELVVGKNYARNGEWIDITMRKVNILLSMDEDADWQNYLKRILVPESQAVNESLKPTETSTNPESLKYSETESLTPLPPLKTLQGASPSSEYASPSKQHLKAKAKPFPPCTHCGFNDHRHDDCRNYLECEVCGRIWFNKCGGITFTKVAFVNGLKYNLISINQLCDAKYIVEFDDKQGTIFNANKEIVLIAPRRNDVYVLDMSSLNPNRACFFAKASESVNWLWHKRISHLNFKNINKLAKQNKALGLPSLVYSKDKPCSACEKGKHKRASFKTKQNFLIRKCLHLLHMDLFGPVSPMSINHKKYTLVIVDEYSRYTWVYFLKKKSQAAEMILSFVRMVENQNDIKVKQIRTDNGTEFRNTELESFCDEKGIS